MKKTVGEATFTLRRSWSWSLLSVACIPLMPEYIAPLMALLALLFAKMDTKAHHRRLRVGAAGKVMVLFSAFMALHVLWATDQSFSAFSLCYWAAMLCVYLALATVLTRPRRIETALFALSVVVGLLGMLACAQYVCVALFGMEEMPLQLWDFLDERVYGLFPVKVHLHSLGIRAAATFSNPNLFAQFIIMAVPLVASYAFIGRRSVKKVISRMCLLFGVVGMCFSFSRAAYLALCAIAVVICIANIRRLVPIVMVAASVVLLVPGAVYDRLISIGNATDVAITERLEVWGVAMQLFFERPVAGHGIGIGTIWERLSSLGFVAPHAHNIFLEFLVEGGLIGLLFLLFMLWRLFRIGFELIIHTPHTRMYGASIVAFCAGFCVYGMFDYMLFAPKTIGMMMALLAVADSLSFTAMNHSPLTMGQCLPHGNVIGESLERWIKKRTDGRITETPPTQREE